MASASTPSATEPDKDLILVHTVQLKPMIKAQISGRTVSSGNSDVAFASVYFEKTRLKKLVMMMMKMIIYVPHSLISFFFFLNDHERVKQWG